MLVLFQEVRYAVFILFNCYLYRSDRLQYSDEKDGRRQDLLRLLHLYLFYIYCVRHRENVSLISETKNLLNRVLSRLSSPLPFIW